MRGKSAPLPQPAPVGLGNYSYSQPGLIIITVYLFVLFTKNDESPDFQAQQASTIRIKAMGFLSGKRILVTGVASKLSIAYGIAQAMHREGAELAFTYQNDKLKGRVEEFAAQLGF